MIISNPDPFWKLTISDPDPDLDPQIENLTFFSGGVPAMYGDLTSGAVIVTTKSYFSGIRDKNIRVAQVREKIQEEKAQKKAKEDEEKRLKEIEEEKKLKEG